MTEIDLSKIKAGAEGGGILPCPFCGEVPHITNDINRSRPIKISHKCEMTLIAMHLMDDEGVKRFAKAWNTRYTDPTTLALVAALEAMVKTLNMIECESHCEDAAGWARDVLREHGIGGGG